MPRPPSFRTDYGPHQLRYRELLHRFPLRPIRSEAELDDATAVIHSLIDLRQRSPAEDDYLDALGDRVMAYEDIHYPMD